MSRQPGPAPLSVPRGVLPRAARGRRRPRRGVYLCAGPWLTSDRGKWPRCLGRPLSGHCGGRLSAWQVRAKRAIPLKIMGIWSRLCVRQRADSRHAFGSAPRSARHAPWGPDGPCRYRQLLGLTFLGSRCASFLSPSPPDGLIFRSFSRPVSNWMTAPIAWLRSLGRLSVSLGSRHSCFSS